QNSKGRLRSAIFRERLERVVSKPLHGQFLRSLQNRWTDKEKTFAWLRSAGLKGETESLLVAAQDQALNTRYHQKKIIGLDVDSKCRVCNKNDETVSHIIAPTEYTHRHNKIATYLHWSIVKELGQQVPEHWYDHQPAPVVEREDVVVMYDEAVITDRTIGANRPDIIIHNKREKRCTLIDVSVPADANIAAKEVEKRCKYKDLEIARMWNTKTKVVQVVVGALGTLKIGFENYLEELPCRVNAEQVQKISLLGTAPNPTKGPIYRTINALGSRDHEDVGTIPVTRKVSNSKAGVVDGEQPLECSIWKLSYYPPRNVVISRSGVLVATRHNISQFVEGIALGV
ncbi:PREDICTED: uncharacterized protein LOC108569451, partial [Nicrophorus vespilloides]|uniref:Uncharacterized protein LOC108569451 n=1 Tax=Nicrophorus vespilloides TaxID=110193 RepID=A0ABM1NI43_NICVS